MNDEYKEYNLLPCPWCENPVHMEGNDNEGYYITCGHVACECPARILHYTAEDAIKHWNDGSDIETINGIRTLPKRRNKDMKRYLLEVDDRATAELNEKTFTLNGQPVFGLSVLANEISMEVLPTDAPLTQVDLDKAQVKGQKEAWELARKICAYAPHGGYSMKDLGEIFGRVDDMDAIFTKYSYKEAAQKVKAWEEEKKAFHVGDIVTLEWGGITHRAVVTRITVNWLSVMFDDGNVDDVGISRCKKTSESVAISDILNQLKKEEK